MTGPDALIAVGVLAALSVLLAMWVVAMRLREVFAAQSDPAGEDTGADWGGETNFIHNGGE